MKSQLTNEQKELNKDKKRAANKAWRLKNPDYRKKRADDPEYRAYMRAYAADYRAKNSEELRKKRQEYRDRPEITAKKASARHTGDSLIEPPSRPRPLHCDICDGTSNNGTRLHFDHCHTTGKFRGWLCNKCNMALGLVKDNPETLLAMVSYLTRIHPRELRGYTVVDPNGSRVASR